MNRFTIWFSSQPRALRLILAVNAVAYLLWQVVLIHIGPTREFVWDHLALNPGFPGILYEPWQLVTYAFLHLQPGLGGLLHVLFNMLWLVWIGRDLEDLQGPARLFGLYVLGAVGGALLTVLLHALFPSVSLFAGTVHGASGAVLAVMAGVALLYPYKEITLFLLGSIRLIHLVLGFLALDILFLASGGTSVSAHLGGVLTGFAFARLQQRGVDTTSWAGFLFSRTGSARSGRQGGPRETTLLARMEAWLARRGSGGDATAPDRRPSRGGIDAGAVREDTPDGAETSDRTIDGILDKISESGYDSLTPEEKRILYEASQR